MSRNSLLEEGAITEVQMTATRLEPTTTYFVNEHSTIQPNWPNYWAVLWVLISKAHLTVSYYHVMYEFEGESTLYSLPECQGTSCLKQVPYQKFKWHQRDSNLQPLIWYSNTQSFSQTGRVSDMIITWSQMQWLWIRILLLSLKLWCLLRARSSLTSLQTIEWEFILKLVPDMIITCTHKRLKLFLNIKRNFQF